MKKFYLLSFSFFVVLAQVYAQYNTARNKVWVFGSHGGINFNTGSPVPFYGGLTSDEASVAVSDLGGNLLFYTNGKQVIDRSGMVMPHGSSIVPFGTVSATQGALIVPVVCHPNQYYIFSLEEYNGGRMAYSIVDMNLNSGYGDLVTGSTGVPLSAGTGLAEMMVAIKGDSGNVWVVVHTIAGGKFRAYNVTAAGVSGPVVSTVGSTGPSGVFSLGLMKASPNGRRIFSPNIRTLFDFNPATGVLTNPIVISGGGWGAEFSPDNSKLYTNNGATGAQFDITLSTSVAINASAVAVGAFSGSMALGPDGKIYFAAGYGSPSMGCINYPNLAGTACGYTSPALTLSTGSLVLLGMPNTVVENIPHDTFYLHHDTLACPLPGGGVVLTAHDTGSVSSTMYLWNDGATTTRTRSVSAVGTYWVYIYNGCDVLIDTIHLTLNPAVGLITGTRYGCVGYTTTLADTTAGGSWSSSNPLIASVGASTGIVTSVSAGVATITYTVPATGCFTTVSYTVNPSPGPITGPAGICPGSTVLYTATLPSGVWSSSSPLIASAGSLSGLVSGIAAGAMVISYTRADGCYATKAVTVHPTPPPIIGDSRVCVGATTVLSDLITGGVWSSGSTSILTIGSMSGIVSGISAGAGAVSYVTPAGCMTTIAVSVNLTPTAVTGTSGICPGALTVVYNGTGGGIWISRNPGIAMVDSFVGLVTGVAPGTVQIVYSMGAACADSMAMTILPVPPPITGAGTLCISTTTTLSDATGGGTWSSGSGGVATVGSTTGIVTGISLGTAVISYSTGGCAVSKTITVTAAPGPISGTGMLCVGGTTILSDIVTGGAWNSGATGTATVGSTGIVTGVAAGVVNITYGMGSGCEVTMPVTVNPLPAPITGTLNVCVGGSTTLSTTSSGGAWSITGSAGVSSGGVVTGSGAGTAIVSYTLPTGCRATAVVTVNPLPGAISGGATVCAGATTTLSCAGGGTWVSSNSAIAMVGTSSGVVTGVVAGSVVITYALPTGCKTIKAMTVNPLPTSILGSASVCVGTAITLSNGITGGAWSASNANVSIGTASGVAMGMGMGTTVITYTLPTGCYITKTITVNSSPGTIGGTLGICIGGTAGLANPTIGGIWTSVTTSVATIGSASGVVSGVNAGLSTISYSVGGGCVATAVVTVNPLPGLYSVAGGGSYCAGGAGLHVSLSGSAGGTTYQLYQGATMVGGPLAGTGGALDFGPQTGAGTYTVVATNASGCTRVMTGSATIVVNPLPAPIGGPSAVCIANTVTQTNTGGGTWLSGTTSIATIGSASGIVTGVTIGTTIITYTLPTGCTVTKIVTVSTSPSAIVGASTVCTGATTTLTNTVGGGGWSSSNTAIGTVDASTGVVYGVSAGAFTISYSLGSGCTVTRAMTVMPSPAVPSGTMSVCVGSSTTLTDATSGGTWSSSLPGVGSVSIVGVVTGVSAGTTVVSYTVSSGCASGITITVNPLPASITGIGTLCVGGSAAATDATGGGVWSTTSSTATIGSTGIVTGVSAGTATITYNVGGCIATRVITVNALPTITGGSGVCIGATVVLTGTTVGGVWNATGTVTVGTTGLVTGVTAGVGMVTYTLPTGCAATKSVTVNTGPSAITGTSSVCVSSTTALTVTTPGGIWSSGGTGTATVNSTTGAVTGVAAGVATITYSLGSGCVATRVVTVNPLPGTISGSGAVCVGGSATLTIGSSGGVWSTDVTGILNIGSSSGVVSGVTTGTATVSYTLPTGCMATRTVTVTPLPTAITGTPRACIGTTTTLATTPSGGVWTSSNVVIASVGSTTGVVNGLNVGTATISYSLGAGCVVTQMITVNALPPAPTVVGSSTAVCAGATVTLTDAITGGTWSSGNTTIATVGSTTGIVTGVAGGSVAISYTVATGCSSTITLSVTAVPPMTGLHNLCAWGDTLNVSDVNPAGTYSSALVTVVNLGGGNGIVTANAPGTATVTYTLSSGCAITRTITVNPLPGSITGSTSVCVGGSAVLTMTTVGGVWSSSATTVATIGSTTGVVNGLTTGVSTIRYMLPTGCKVDTVVHVYPLPAPITVMSSTVLVGVSIPFGDPTPGGTWSSGSTAIATVGAGTGMVHGVAPGMANIRYTLPTGCGVGRNVSVIGAPGTGK